MFFCVDFGATLVFRILCAGAEHMTGAQVVINSMVVHSRKF